MLNPMGKIWWGVVVGRVELERFYFGLEFENGIVGGEGEDTPG